MISGLWSRALFVILVVALKFSAEAVSMIFTSGFPSLLIDLSVS